MKFSIKKSAPGKALFTAINKSAQKQVKGGGSGITATVQNIVIEDSDVDSIVTDDMSI